MVIFQQRPRYWTESSLGLTASGGSHWRQPPPVFLFPKLEPVRRAPLPGFGKILAYPIGDEGVLNDDAFPLHPAFAVAQGKPQPPAPPDATAVSFDVCMPRPPHTQRLDKLPHLGESERAATPAGYENLRNFRIVQQGGVIHAFNRVEVHGDLSPSGKCMFAAYTIYKGYGEFRGNPHTSNFENSETAINALWKKRVEKKLCDTVDRWKTP